MSSINCRLYQNFIWRVHFIFELLVGYVNDMIYLLTQILLTVYSVHQYLLIKLWLFLRNLRFCIISWPFIEIKFCISLKCEFKKKRNNPCNHKSDVKISCLTVTFNLLSKPHAVFYSKSICSFLYAWFS